MWAQKIEGEASVTDSGRPANMPWITPYLTVKDGATAVEFYEKAFGFTAENVMKCPDGKVGHAKLTWNDGVIMLGPEGAYGGTALSPATGGFVSPIVIYVYVADVDATFERATAAGAKTQFPPTDTFWGDRICHLIDPDGYGWNFATNNQVWDPNAPVAVPAADTEAVLV